MLIVALIVAYAIVLFVLQFLPIVFVGYGLVALIHAYILNHMFKPLIAQSLGEQDPDAWTVPEEEEGQDKAGEETAEGNAEGKENAADVWPPVKNG